MKMTMVNLGLKGLIELVSRYRDQQIQVGILFYFAASKIKSKYLFIYLEKC